MALATALRRRGLGTSAADRLRAWWAWRGVHNAQEALQSLRQMAIGPGMEAPGEPFAYVPPQLQELVMLDSEANDLVGADLLRQESPFAAAEARPVGRPS